MSSPREREIDFLSTFTHRDQPRQARDMEGRFKAVKAAVAPSRNEAFLEIFGKQGSHVTPKPQATPLTDEQRWQAAANGSPAQSFAAAFAPESLSHPAVRFTSVNDEAAESEETTPPAPLNGWEAERQQLRAELEELQQQMRELQTTGNAGDKQR